MMASRAQRALSNTRLERPGGEARCLMPAPVAAGRSAANRYPNSGCVRASQKGVSG